MPKDIDEKKVLKGTHKSGILELIAAPFAALAVVVLMVGAWALSLVLDAWEWAKKRKNGRGQ